MQGPFLITLEAEEIEEIEVSKGEEGMIDEEDHLEEEGDMMPMTTIEGALLLHLTEEVGGI